MNAKYAGLLGCIAEASDIKNELGVSIEEAWAIQRERADARYQEYLAEKQAIAESNVIQFRPRGQ
jgi:hypothetical protein